MLAGNLQNNFLLHLMWFLGEPRQVLRKDLKLWDSKQLKVFCLGFSVSLQIQCGMAANKITLWTLEFEATNREYFDKVDIGSAAMLDALRFMLESNDILEWAFDFWDFEDKQCIRKKLERLNGFEKEVHVIRVGEGNSDGSKRRRLVDGSFTVTMAQVAAAL